jgi:para-nitrobenzyl esterase
MFIIRIAFALLLFGHFCSKAVSGEANCPAGADVACIEQGGIRGVIEGEMLAFKGIPYAQPPIGALRWTPPATAPRWEAVRDGSHYGAMCPQLAGNNVEGAEDCLYLNVWRPREKPERPLPVMIWLTGGGNHSYSGEGSPGFGGVLYNGLQLVPRGVVFVSYNLRLGAFGFLAHPSLDAERPEKISGNYGSLDQIAMLRWVHSNISGFGGDPDHVFLFGTSAGGGNICALMTSPLTRGLIHGAAMESSVPSGCELQTLADAEKGMGERVVQALGCNAASDVAGCLRAKSMKEIVAAVPGNFSVLPRVYGPNMDGHVFPEQPIKLIEQRKYPPMPIIIGNTAGETLGWADSAGKVTDDASYAAAIDKVFGRTARDRIVELYPPSAYPTQRKAFAQLTTDAEFTCTSRRVSRMLSRSQTQPVYRYLFNHSLENDPGQKELGPIHTIEHAFLFGWQGKYKPNDTDLSVQRQMTGYWTSMAKTGSPNGNGNPEWPAVAPEKDAFLEISSSITAQTGPADAHCDFWDLTPMLWPHM